MGFYSDPHGINLYTIQWQDKDRLSVYHWKCGTNNVEGGIHQNIIKYFGSYNASPRFAVNLLCDYCLYHNLQVHVHIFNIFCLSYLIRQVGTYNCTGVDILVQMIYGSVITHPACLMRYPMLWYLVSSKSLCLGGLMEMIMNLHQRLLECYHCQMTLAQSSVIQFGCFFPEKWLAVSFRKSL